MVNVRALVCLAAMLWAGTGQGALVYLDAAFASDTVAEDSTGLVNIGSLTANSSGVIYGGHRSDTTLYKITGGVYEPIPITAPGGVGPVRMQNENTVLMGTWFNFAGTPTDSAKVVQVSSAGVVSDFITLPFAVSYVDRIAVSPASGDILVNAADRLIKYNSAGALQWDVAALPGFTTAINYSPTGQAYAASEDGSNETAPLYAINSDTGEMTLQSFSVPVAFGDGGGIVHDMVFSSGENLFTAITSNNNNVEIFRTNINTGVSEMLAHWDFEVPLVERWLEYVDGAGLYVNSFDSSEVPPELQSFGLSFSLESSTSSVLLLSGDFNGDFAGFSLESLAPEPGSAWLLLGLLAWKRKTLANRHSPPGKDSR